MALHGWAKLICVHTFGVNIQNFSAILLLGRVGVEGLIHEHLRWNMNVFDTTES